MLTFAEELLTLIIDGENVKQAYIPDRAKRFALAGAVLMELALENRIDTDVESLYVTDPTPLGDALLDPALAEIAQEGDTRPAQFWVRRIAGQSDELREAAQARLLEAGILETDDGGLLSLSRRIARSRRYPPHLALAGASSQEIQTRLRDVLYSDGIPAPRDCILISLANACDIFRQILDREEYEEVRERIELLARLELVGRSVTDAIRNLSLAESQALTRVIREQGGGWPRASGGLPVAGHAFHLSGDLRAFLTKQYLKLGPVFEVNAFGRKIVVMAGREANQFMIREGKAHLRNRELVEGMGQDLGASNILLGMDGPEHLRLRKTQRHGYSREIILQQMSQAVAVAESEMSRLPPDRPIGGFHTIQRISTEQIAVISAGTSSLDYLEDTIAFGEMMLAVYVTKRQPRFMSRMPRIKRALRRMEELFEKALASHEPELRTGDRRDIVDDLLELHRSSPDFMPDTDLFINVMGPFLVGIETVSASTAFMLYALLKHPDLLERVRVEADGLFAGGGPDVDKLHGMTVTQRVILETLRMYPIAPALFRTVTNSFDFAGYRIPAGTPLIVALSVPHYLPKLFPDPERFDIDRYSPERRENAQPGAYAPFGLGHHSCLGQGFAQVQMLLTIATMLHRAEIALDPPGYQLKIKQTPTPRPHHSFKVRLRPRQ